MKSYFRPFLSTLSILRVMLPVLGLLLAVFPATAQSTTQQSNCHAQFVSSLDSCPTINFTDQSIASGFVQYYWTFGDGGTSNLQHPSHTYASNGVYEVCLNIWVDFSCTSSACVFVTVECMGCEAGFLSSMPNCPSVDFSDTSAVSLGTIVAWHWTFGDGGTDSVQNPTHAYAANGTYSVCLQTVTDSGCVASRCMNTAISCIVGTAEPQSNFEVTITPQPMVDDQLAFTVAGAAMGPLDCALYALDGRLLRRCEIVQESGLGRHSLEFPVAAGLYLLRVTAADGEVRVLRVVRD